MKRFIKKYTKPLFLMVAACLSGLLATSLSMAQAYIPSAPVIILSGTSMVNDPYDADSLVEWTVVPEKDSTGKITLSVHLSKSRQLICQLILNGSEKCISWNNTTQIPHAIVQPDLLIVPGSNVPCDLLPIEKMINSQEAVSYEVRREAGGQTIVDRIQVESIVISPDDAIQKGWVSADVQLMPRLVMVRVINLRTKALLVQQLWADGNDWWLYEETPFRKSWRIQ